MGKRMMSSHQPSLTEWLASVGSKADAEKLRKEDNSRLSRWRFLNDLIGFPADLPTVFEAVDLTTPSDEFKKLLEEKGEELAAIRLVPKTPDLPKLRMRGPSLNECYNDWYKKQEINPEKYLAEVYEHIEHKAWATTFIVNEKGIFGEIIAGSPSQLTHGETENELYQFSFDYNNWTWSKENSQAEEALLKMFSHIKVEDEELKGKIKEKLDVNFYHNYLEGYYEGFIGVNEKIMFIDYGVMLAKHVGNPPVIKIEKADAIVSGAVAYGGKAAGKVKMVDIENFDMSDFAEGDILVTDNTDVRYVPLMKKAGAIVTDRGGILSHAAIVSRELKKPCIIGTGEATKVLKDGQMVEVNAGEGVVKLV